MVAALPLLVPRYGLVLAKRFPAAAPRRVSNWALVSAVVVLGLVSSKEPRIESQDELRRRIDDASRYVPIENLALSPQCGFASTAAGNLLTEDEK